MAKKEKKTVTQKPIEIARDIWWVGKQDQDGDFDCNPYLIIDKDNKGEPEAVLMDPGSPLDFEEVKSNIESLISLDRIKLIIVHHQDPDLCASLPLFEKVGVTASVALHWRTSTMVRYYGVQNNFYHVNENNWKWEFSSGRELVFIQAPYCHFPGAMMTYDASSRVLFSGDLFGAFLNKNPSLYAGEDYLEGMKTFHEHYMPSHRILKGVMNSLNDYDISIIAPQHGRVIDRDIPRYISTLSNLKCGSLMLGITVSGSVDVLNRSTAVMLLSELTKRFFSLKPKEDVLALFDSSDFRWKDEEISIGSINPPEALNKFLALIEEKKGKGWISIVEPYLQMLLLDYNISRSSVKAISGGLTLNPVSGAISPDEAEFSYEEGMMVNAKDNLLFDDLTGLNNQDFFQSYIDGFLSDPIYPSDVGLLYIAVDNLMDINQTHGRRAGDEILKTFAYSLRNTVQKIGMERTHLFKLNNPIFVLASEGTDLENLKVEGEKIITSIRNSDFFIEKLNISVGATISSEWEHDSSFYDLDKLNKAKLILSGNRGSNSVCSDLGEEAPEAMFQKKVLLVEPDHTYFDILAAGLKKHSISVMQVSDGSMTFERRKMWSPDLIVAEAMTPKVSGFELKERINSLTGRTDTPFILISARKDDDFIRRAARLGIVHFLRKPFPLIELELLIVNLLEQKRCH